MRRVLFVSPDADYREIYSTGLAHAGFLVAVLEQLGAAGSAVQAADIDCGVLHLDWDDEAGWAACRAFVERCAPKPVVLLTSWIHTDARNVRKAFELGCAAFVVVPCPANDLADIIGKVISGERNVEWPVKRL